jgi:hypothetical protein
MDKRTAILSPPANHPPQTPQPWHWLVNSAPGLIWSHCYDTLDRHPVSGPSREITRKLA